MTARDAKITELICLIRNASEASKERWKIAILNASSLDVFEKACSCERLYNNALHALQRGSVVYCLACLINADGCERSAGFQCAIGPLLKVQKFSLEDVSTEPGMGSGWGENG